MLANHYPSLLAGHLLAVALFGGGVAGDAFSIPGLARRLPDERAAELARSLALALYLTTPAMLLAWIFGSLLALSAGWFAAPWLQIKLLFVAALTVLHGRHIVLMRRMQRGGTVTPARWPAAFIIVALGLIVILAGAKPM